MLPEDSEPAVLIAEMGRRARQAAAALARAPTERKAAALCAAAAALRDGASTLLAANAADMERARAMGLPGAMLDRLELDPARIEGIAAALDTVAALDDPVGQTIDRRERPNGLVLERVRVPLGVVGIVFESRPNVTADAGGLAMMAVDVIVPRGGKSLVARVQEEARVPVLAHLDGIVHLYVDRAADPAKARDILLNAKLRRTGVCGAAETLLIDRAFADPVPLLTALADAGCEIRGTPEVCGLEPRAVPAGPDDWDTEYLEPILSVGLVDGVEGAMAHIAAHGSHHTDAIVTEDAAAAETFLARVDSAIVMWNASTQFADGGEFGLGAEIGISTGRLHARGPVALEGLTTYKWLVRGTGQVRP